MEQVKNTVKKGVHDINDVKHRIEKRKNDTLIKALEGGEEFSKKVLLPGIQGSIYSEQERDQIGQHTVDAKIESIQGPEME